MKKLILISAVLLIAPAVARAQTEVSGSISAGGRGVDNDTDSSKLTEYRDLRNDALVPRLTLSAFNKDNGWYFDFVGSNVSLDDRTLRARGGKLGKWTLDADWTGIPHDYSNKARTPYFRSSPGQLDVASTIPITFKKLATSGSDAASVVAMDSVIAAYQAGALSPTALATQSSVGRFTLSYDAVKDMRLAVTYDRRVKGGLKPSFGPIGDRPPRTLNIQLTEPIDYRTQDLTLEAEWTGRKYQAQFSYRFSDFANAIDTFTWQNVYATAATPDATFDNWDRSVSTFGRRALYPDNRSHNASVSLGAELPADSRLSATFAYGRTAQDQTLLPYSFNSSVLANQTLPRATAQGEIVTKQAFLDYVISPTSRLNLRAWARFAGLDNNTPEAQWQYVTSDTSNLNGTVAYVNKRVNVPYAQDRLNAGGEMTYRFDAWHSSLGLGYERESVDRDHREADTDENRVTASFRARPASWARLRVRYLFGKRDGNYDPFVTREGYWYSPAEASDKNNPQFTFDNHPDMVRYDVADRQRHQIDASLTLTRGEKVSVTASARYRSDDFDSKVRPVQPLASTGVGEVDATSPGNQLGLLEDKRMRYGLDVSYVPTERASIGAFVSFEKGTNLQRGLEFDENQKMTPSSITTADLGPWTRASSQWTADFDDRTWTAGFAGHFSLSKRVTLNANYTLSLGNLDILYGGYGVTNWNGTEFAPNYQFAFPAVPGPVKNDLHLVDVRLEFPLVRDVTAVVGYNYERYRIDDWMQSKSHDCLETVGSEFLIRDNSRSQQWGNRLFNLGTYLAPGYDAHVAWMAFTYRF